ncbi:MAG: hypothetical protein B6I36_07435 [Desulfobacteraceae bacterium 4572_35.1]|nr:MAG: hypothetical protein B6I36_07435 [Desulfobacteraceae bacterium 4572_35.1]
MQVRVFESENMDSALRQIKETLGPDALILSSRTVRKGGMGLFGKPMLEVTAAIDPASAAASDATAPAASVVETAPLGDDKIDNDVSYQELWQQSETGATPQSLRPNNESPQIYNSAGISPVVPTRGAKFERILKEGQRVASGSGEVRSYDSKSLLDLHSEMGELRSMLTTLVNDLPRQIEKAGKSKAPPIVYSAINSGVNTQTSQNQPVLDALTKLGVESEAARPAQLQEVLQRHSNKDLILIDTAGRSPKDDVSLNELHEFLAVDSAIESHLVLSATTRERDLYETYGRFAALGPKSLLMTKLDECDCLGVLLNVHLRNNCPLSYLANGQKVPEDLVQASAELVSALIMEHS